MWLFRRRSVSPNSENNDPTNKIQEAQVKLLTAKDELVDLPIPKMKETFVMIYDLLELCKKSKGDPAPINAFIELMTRLIDGVHDSVTKSKRRGEADMAKSPADSIEALFTELFHLFSARQQLSASSTDRTDLSSNLATLNPDISAAIQKFINKESNHDRAEQVRAWVLDMSRIDQSTGESIDVGKVIKQAQHPLTIPRNTNPEQVFPGATHNDKFRILLLGKSGVGKSSLIQSIFGVRQMDVAVSESDLVTSIESSRRPITLKLSYMIWQDLSQDLPNYQNAEKFIQERGEKTEFLQQLHAIWVCVPTPVVGNEGLEIDERLLEMNTGRVPVIMVFTKYDTLVDHKTMELLGTAGTDDEEQLIHDAKDGAEKDFDRLCVQPLTEIYKTIQKESPLVTKVSVNPGYEETLPELVQFTKQVVTDVMHQSGQLQTMSSAQNGQILDVHTLVQMSTAMGRKHFWKCFGSIFYLWKKRARNRCLAALHDDIVGAWNLYDPSGWLTRDGFKKQFRTGVKDMIIETTHESIPTLSLIASLAILLAVLAPLLGAAPIVAGVMFPFLAGMTGFVWYIDLYIPSSEIIQLYMSYTVDLSLVMRRLFWEMRRLGGVQSLPEEVFQSVHEDIWSFVTENRFKRFNQEKVLEKIAELIDKYHADPEVKASDSSSVESLDTQSESIFSPVDLSKWWNKLSQPPLATGGNSDVYKTSLIPGPHYPTEQLIAVKVLRPVRIPDEKLSPEILKKRLLREAQIWIQLNHKNIIPILGFGFQDNIPCLVSPWFENGDALN